MKKLIPVNKHLLIEPVKHEAFISSQNETYQEIGKVLALPNEWDIFESTAVDIGDYVYFDSWLASKFPSETDGEHYWLVKWEDVRAYAKEIPE